MPNDEQQIEPKVTYSYTDPNWGWTVNAGTYMMDFNKPAQSIFNFIFIIIGITLVVGITIIWLFAHRISAPITQVTKSMHYLAEGDLTKEPVQISTNDEVGQLASAMNDMQQSLKDIITNVTQAAETMSERSDELTQSADEVKSGSEQVAITMHELATGAETQANSASELSSNMVQFTEKINEATINGHFIKEASDDVHVLTTDGSNLMENSMKQMTRIDEIVHDAVGKVEGLDRQSKEISSLVSMIKDIADQTNLLALNAAIEAARAGEHGNGFAVVADEVRKLAEQVSNSVSGITSIVETIQTESNVVSSSLQAGYIEVEQGSEQIKTTNEKFVGIQDAVNEMTNKIELVTENLEDISTTNQSTNQAIEEIAAVSEQSAAGVEQTSASSQQTTASMEDVAEGSNELSALARNLHEIVRRFTL